MKKLVATAILSVLATFSAEARTLTVSSETKTSVSLAFGEPDGRTYTLVYAYGATDGGSNRAAP